MTPPPPEVAIAVYDSVLGQIIVSATEPVTVVDDAVTPWTVTAGFTNQPPSQVMQSGPNVLLEVPTGIVVDVFLSYAGGEFVQGDETGLFLEPVTSFPVMS